MKVSPRALAYGQILPIYKDVTRHFREKARRDAELARERSAIKRVKEWRPIAWEWQDKVTAKAVHYPTYGWVPKVALAGRTPDGRIVPWAETDYGHVMLIAEWFVAKKLAAEENMKWNTILERPAEPIPQPEMAPDLARALAAAEAGDPEK